MTILIYYVLLEALNAVRQQAQLEERAAQQDTLLAMQYTQYQQLSRHIEEVREARHDLRQHLNLIEHYLQSGKTEDLNTYIEQYRMTLPPDTARTWCENYAVNTIISYYGGEARKASVDFSVRIQLPPSLRWVSHSSARSSAIFWKMPSTPVGNVRTARRLSASAPRRMPVTS